MQNILRGLSLATVVAIGGANGTAAQSLGLAFGADGRLAAGFTDQVPGASLFFFGDATARLSGAGSPLGFELGVFGLANVADTPHETYGTFTWDFAQGGRLFVGVPRPAYDSFAVSAVERFLPSLGVSRTAATRSLATYGAMFEGYLPYGVRFESATDALRFAASIDSVPNRDTTIASIGIAMPIGAMTLESAVEVASASTTRIAAKVQVTGTIGGLRGGLGLYRPGTVGGPDLMEAFLTFTPTEKITVSGAVQVPLGGIGDPSAGVSARYAISTAVGLSAGVLRDADANMAYSALLDLRF